MSDELVKRLRNPPFGTETSERLLTKSAAARISALEAALAKADELEDVIDKPDQSDGQKGRYHYDWQRVDETLTAYSQARDATR